MLAEAGFTALIWSPYPGKKPPADMNAAQAMAATLNDGALGAITACVDHMLGPMRLPAVAVMGFCLGGRYAVVLAGKDRRITACVPYYPSIRVPMKPNESEDALMLAAQITGPVHLVHGAADKVFLPPVYEKLRGILEQRQAATFVQVHPGADHSFVRPEIHTNPANVTATRLSWPPVVSFLQACLPPA